MTYGTLPGGSGEKKVNGSFGYLVGVVNGLVFAAIGVALTSNSALFSSVSKQDGTFPVESMIHEPPLPATPADLQSSLDAATAAREIVKRVQPSIVTILSETEITTPAVEMMGVVLMNETKQNQSALGTGVVMMIDGKQVIMTAAHVVADAHTILIQDANHDIWGAKTVLFNAPHDLGSIELTNLTAEGTPIQMQYNGATTGLEMTPPGAMNTGDDVMAFGNNMGLGLAVTSGIVSAIGKQVVELSDNSTIELPIFQTDASINHGNSGGALVDTATGKVCGITNSIISNNGGNIGIGFAITANTVRSFLAGELKNGDLMPPPEEQQEGGDGYAASASLEVDNKKVIDETATPKRLIPKTDLN